MPKGTISQRGLFFLCWLGILAFSCPSILFALEPAFDLIDQGLNENEEAIASQVIDILLAEDESLDMIVTYRKYRDGEFAYQACAKRDLDGSGQRQSGQVWFRRHCQEASCSSGLQFAVLEASPEGFNDFLFGDPDSPTDARKNPAGLSSLDEEIEAGDNPNQYSCHNDDPTDARCRYIEPEKMPLPYIYERLAAVLDEPRAGDLIIIPKSYSEGSIHHLGTHGHPGVVQSRVPLVMAGAGVKKGGVVSDPEAVPRVVDIAPTVAYLLDLPKRDGVNFSGLRASERGVPPDVYLDRQDGQALQGIYDDEDKILYTYLVVIDGLRPQDALNERLAPTLAQLISEENTTYWQQARAIMTTRTNTNHTAMITGAYGETSGIVSNEFCEQSQSFVSSYQGITAVSHCRPASLEDPAYLDAETLFQAIEAQRPELVTAAILGKQKLTDLLSRDADIAWGGDEAGFFEKDLITGYAFDWRTMDEVLRVSQHYDSDFTFVNLADVDRLQHLFGPGSPEARQAVTLADLQIGRLIDYLKQSGKWERAVVIVTADHGFTDVFYAPQQHYLLKALADFQADTDLVFLANGGTNNLYIKDFDPDNSHHQQRLHDIRQVIVSLGLEGIDEVLYRLPNPFDPESRSDLQSVHPNWHINHERVGELIITAREGFAFCDHPNIVRQLGCLSLPVMNGDHGGPYQRHIPLLITGSSLVVEKLMIPASEPLLINENDDTEDLPEQAELVDLAPTLAWLYGIDPPLQSQGRILTEAFDDPIDPVGALGPYAPYVVLMISDGLSHTAVMNALYGNSWGLPQPDISSDYGLRYLVEKGLFFQYGAITNFPSVTYPSHNTMGSGAWSGHHGIVGNSYYIREKDRLEAPINDLLLTEKYLRPRPAAATLHEVVHDAFGLWEAGQVNQGAFTASILEPSSRGSNVAVTELRTLPLSFPAAWSAFFDYLGESARPYSEGGDTNTIYEEKGLSDLSLYSLGDSFGQGLYRSFIEESNLATPRYTNYNFVLTDGAAHYDGPHGEVSMAGIQDMDRRLSRMVESVKEKGLLRKTLFILTADHGMENQDPSRSGSYRSILDRHNVKYNAAGSFLYLKCMNIELDNQSFASGIPKTLTVTITDDDLSLSNEGGLVPAPLAGADVTLTNGTTSVTRVSNAQGQVVFSFTPNNQDVVTIQADHENFNPQAILFEVVSGCGCMQTGDQTGGLLSILQLAVNTALIFFVLFFISVVKLKIKREAQRKQKGFQSRTGTVFKVY